MVSIVSIVTIVTIISIPPIISIPLIQNMDVFILYSALLSLSLQKRYYFFELLLIFRYDRASNEDHNRGGVGL